MRTDADRDSSKVPPAPNSHPKFPKTYVRSVRSVRNVRRGHAARGGQRFREVSQMPGRQNTLPKPAAALAAVRLTTLVGYGAGMAGKCGDVCGCMRLGESTRKRARRPTDRRSSPPSRVPASLLRYRGEQTRSGRTLEINCPNERFATEKLLRHTDFSILSCNVEIYVRAQPLVGHHSEEKKSSM